MIVTNVRNGLATNSSSTHSIVISSSINKTVNDLCDNDFGWDYFTAYKPESKLKYLGILLDRQLSGEIETESISHVIMSKYLNGVLPDPDSNIDHQSIFSFPLTYGTRHLDIAFFNEFKDFILRDDVAICGGNDNGGEASEHPLLKKIQYTNVSALLPFIKGNYGDGKFWCRKDGEFWTLFDQKGLRYTFSYNDFAKPIVKYNTPLLVDLKITDYCATGCTFCYQSSTKQGKPADFEKIKGTLDALAKLKVFEVAIGGGNPVSHPKFIEILEYARSLGIVPNFSTRDLSFFRDKAALKRIATACGSFAFSVNPDVNLEKLARDIKGFNKLRQYDEARLMNLQVFIGPGGFNTDSQLLPILAVAREHNCSVTILGFKEVGRGLNVALTEEQQNEAKYPWGLTKTLMALEADGRCPNIGIDTVLAKEISPSFLKYGISNKLFVVDEGKSSCYIDAVTETIARSSFEPTRGAIDITNTNQIKEAFATF
jgi:hypothetical protein